MALARRAQGTRLPPRADLSALPAPARDLVLAADSAARADSRSAAAVGALGQAYHASLMPAQAMTYYRLAEGLDPSAWEWTYYRGLLHEERGEHPTRWRPSRA